MIQTPIKNDDNSNYKTLSNIKGLDDTAELFNSVPGSLRSNKKLKGLSQEALCQSIELLKLEIQDVRDREKSQEDMYK